MKTSWITVLLAVTGVNECVARCDMDAFIACDGTFNEEFLRLSQQYHDHRSLSQEEYHNEACRELKTQADCFVRAKLSRCSDGFIEARNKQLRDGIEMFGCVGIPTLANEPVKVRMYTKTSVGTGATIGRGTFNTGSSTVRSDTSVANTTDPSIVSMTTQVQSPTLMLILVAVATAAWY